MSKISNLTIALDQESLNGGCEKKSFNLEVKEDCLAFLEAVYGNDLWEECVNPIWDSKYGAFDWMSYGEGDHEEDPKTHVLEYFLDEDFEANLVMFHVTTPLTLVNWGGEALNKCLVLNSGFGPLIKSVYQKHSIFTLNLLPERIYLWNKERKTITWMSKKEAAQFIFDVSGVRPYCVSIFKGISIVDKTAGHRHLYSPCESVYVNKN